MLPRPVPHERQPEAPPPVPVVEREPLRLSTALWPLAHAWEPVPRPKQLLVVQLPRVGELAVGQELLVGPKAPGERPLALLVALAVRVPHACPLLVVALARVLP